MLGCCACLDMTEPGDSNLANKEAMLEAASTGDLHRVQQLVENGVLIDCQNKEGLTALHAAAMSRRHDIVDYLLTNGANAQLKTVSGRTVLHNACARSDAVIVETLLDAGCEINQVTDDGLRPLDYAIQWNREDIVRVLQQRGGRSQAT